MIGFVSQSFQLYGADIPYGFNQVSFGAPILNPYGSGITIGVYPGGIPSPNLYGASNLFVSYPGVYGSQTYSIRSPTLI